MACESLRAKGTRDAELLAMLQLIGAAGSLVSRRRGMVGRGDKTPMVSVTNVDPERMAELLEDFSHRRPHRAAAGAVDPQRQALRRHHRDAGATRSIRALLQQDHRTRRGRTQEQDSAAARSSRPEFHGIQVEVGFHTPRLADGVELSRELGGANRARPPSSPTRFDRGGVRPPVDWVAEVETAARVRREVDHRPRTERHRDAADRTGRPGSRRRSRSRGHPGRSAQPVHRRRRARGTAAVVELCADHRQAARRLGEAVDQVHPADRTFADPACGHDPDDRRRQDRRGCRQRRPLGRTGRRRSGHRGDLRGPHRRTHRAARAGPRCAVQRAVPGSLPVEAAGRWKAVGAEGPSVRRPDRRCRRRPRAFPTSRTPSS